MCVELFARDMHHGVMRPSVPILENPSDAELLAEFRSGAATALGTLLERHLPGLRASAIRRLGFRADADDAVQETCLIALTRIGDVRSPDAIVGWLHTVLARVCLQMQRKGRREVREPLRDAALLAVESDVESRVERRELREWIWRALDELSEPLRITTLLRYFGSYDSYEDLAAILGVPVGTIRSRIAEARARLATSLLATAAATDDAARIAAEGKRRLWTEAFDGIYRRGDSTEFITHFRPDLLVGWSTSQPLRGRDRLAREIESDIDAGVHLEVQRIIANRSIVVVEGRFRNPVENPTHCPPGIAMVLSHRAERAEEIRLHLAPRPPRTDDM